MEKGCEEKEILNGQQRHWEKMFAENADMFGREESYPAKKAAGTFLQGGATKILELGSGQGRDTLFFARQGLRVWALDYSMEGLEALRSDVEREGLSASLDTIRHDVRQPLPFDDDSFDGCYSHMLYCMALTTPELESLSREVRRVIKPGGLNIYTVRHTGDPHYGSGVDHGDDIREIGGGFIVHFFSRQTVEDLAEGYEILSVEEFEETKLPKRLFLVTLRKSL